MRIHGIPEKFHDVQDAHFYAKNVEKSSRMFPWLRKKIGVFTLVTYLWEGYDKQKTQIKKGYENTI